MSKFRYNSSIKKDRLAPSAAKMGRCENKSASYNRFSVEQYV